MDNQKLSVRKFSGLSHENAKSFLSDFTAYCSLMKLSNDKLKSAAFQLHLQGPAKTWLENLATNDWNTILFEFQNKYVDISQSDIIFETGKFQTFSLKSQQSLDEYAGLVRECGVKLQKSDTDTMLAFINGLPQRLAFFTRAGSPKTMDDALNAAKLGEAYGYRDVLPEYQTVAAARTVTDFHSLEDKVEHLSHRLNQLLTNDSKSIQDDRKLCYNCNSVGHLKRKCNLARGPPKPESTCQLCGQYGHEARQCQTHQPPQMQGNLRRPRGDDRGPSIGQHHNRGGGKTGRW